MQIRRRPRGGIAILASNATLISNTVAGNHAFFGGGIYLDHSDAALIKNIITGNSSSCPGHGGGLVIDNSRVTLKDNIVSGNSTDGSGGGLSISNSDAVLVNNVFTGNRTVHNYTQGIIISGGSFRASHTTFSDHGRNIYLGGDGNAVFTNTIMVNVGTGIIVASDSKAWLNGVLW